MSVLIYVIFGGLEILMQTIYFARKKKGNSLVIQLRLDYFFVSNSLQEVIIINIRF